MKRSTGRSKVARMIAVGLATVITATSVPVNVLADEEIKTEAQQEEQKVPEFKGETSTSITVENLTTSDPNDTLTMDFSSNNLTPESKQAAQDAHNSLKAAGEASTAATAAATAATAAQTAQGQAEAAADAAEKLATAAATAAAALTGANAVDVDGAVGLVTTAENAIGATNSTDENTANGAVNAANAADTALTNQYTTANGAIAAYNGEVAKVNEKIETANNSKNDSKDKEGKTVLGTDSLIQAAKDKASSVDDAIQAAKDNNVTQASINEVITSVGEAEQAYKTADTNANTALNNINNDLAKALSNPDIVDGAAAAAQGAEDARKQAEIHDGTASDALTETEKNYNGVKNLVETGSHDVAAANQFAADAALSAQAARQAANNADAAAKTAATAEATAKAEFEAAKAAFDAALEALKTARDNYNTDIKTANGKADTADAAVENLIGKEENGKHVDGLIDIANEKIKEANKAVSDYNNGEVAKANAAVTNTNNLIDEAQAAINGLDSTDMDTETRKIAGLKTTANKKASDAKDKISDAQKAWDDADKALKDAINALEKAKADYEKAQEKYKDANGESETAAKLAAEAKTAADEAANQAKEAEFQSKIADAREGLTKDYLAEATNGTSYQILGERLNTAESEKNKAQTDKDNADAALTQAQKQYQAVYDVQNPIVTSQQAIIDEKTTQIGDNNSGWTKQKNDLQNSINTINNALGAYNKAVENEKEAKAKYEALNWWDWTYGKGEIIALDYVNKQETTKNKFKDLKSAIGQNPSSGSEAVTIANSLLTSKGIELTTVTNNITNATTAKTNATTARDIAQGLINAEDEKVKTATTNQGNADKALSTRTEEYKTALANKNKVDNFVVTEANAIELGAEDIKLINEIITTYGKPYNEFDENVKSYLAIDADTNKYRDVMNSTAADDVIATIGNWFSGIFTGNNERYELKNKMEVSLEKKYGGQGNVFWFWQWSKEDNKNLTNMVNKTNEACVLICTDADKVAEIKASLAVLNAAKAVKDAKDASDKAADALKRANDAETKEEKALKDYNGAMKKLTDAQTKLNGLTVPTYTQPTSYGTLDPVTQLLTLTGKYDVNNLGYSAKTNDGPAEEISKDGIKLTSRVYDEIDFDYLIDILTAKKNGDEGADDIDLPVSDDDVDPLIQLIKNLKEAANEFNLASTNYENAKKERKSADKLVISSNDAATEAERLAKEAAELAKRVLPEVVPGTPDETPDAGGDDDTTGGDTDAGTGTDEGTGTTYTLPTEGMVATTGTVPVYDLTGAGTGRAVAGARTGRTGRARGVAGVRVENDGDGAADGTGSDSKVVVADTNTKKEEVKADAGEDKSGKTGAVKIADPETPLAANPYEEGFNPNWLWLLLVAAAIISGVVVYENHKKKVAANNESKKYKK